MILIIAAMPEELEEILKLTDSYTEKIIDDVRLIEAKLANKDVLISLSGIGKTNAAFTTAIIAKSYPVEFIVNIGTAGGLLSNQEIGDIVISNVTKTHDLDIGELSHLDPRFIHYADKKAITLVQEILEASNQRFEIGEIISGDQFVVYGSPAYNRIVEKFPKAICVEMEANAVASVATRLKIPFVVIRSISDIPNKSGNELEFEEFLPIAAKNSAVICKEFVSKY